MAIVKHPRQSQKGNKGIPPAQRAFIDQGRESSQAGDERGQPKKPIMIRIDPDLLARIDRGAKRLGISRSAFIVLSTAERLEHMKQ